MPEICRSDGSGDGAGTSDHTVEMVEELNWNPTQSIRIVWDFILLTFSFQFQIQISIYRWKEIEWNKEL